MQLRTSGANQDNTRVVLYGTKVDYLLTDLLHHSVGKKDQLQVLEMHRKDQMEWQACNAGRRAPRRGTSLVAWKTEVEQRKQLLKRQKRK